MITELHLGNFKAFAAPVSVPIRPLTLIFGPNSAGKSSLIHGLALGHEATRPNGQLDVRHTELGGDAIDLGGFRQYVHRRALDRRVTWGVALQPEAEHDAHGLVPGIDSLVMLVSFGLPLDQEERPIARGKPSLTSFQLAVNDECRLRMSRRSDGQLRVDELTAPLAKLLWPHNGDGSRWTAETRTRDESWIDEAIQVFSASPLRLFPQAPPDGLTPDDFADGLARLFFTVENHVKAELGRLSYLGPLRSYPPRHMAFADQDDTNRAAGGGRAWDRMRKSKKLRDAVNAWLNSKDRLQTPYRIMLQRFLAPTTAWGAIGAGLDEILHDLTEVGNGEAEEASTDAARPLDRWDRDAFVKIITRRLVRDHEIEGDDDLVLIDMRTATTVSHRDVGIGISQVLPVLVEAYGNEGRLVAIEQPEIHLHPRLQAELGDVFIESALGERKNTFLLETHSEHLMLRVLRRIRETAQGTLPEGLAPVRPEDVAVLFVAPEDTGTRIVEIPISNEGEFTRPWPGGFFADRMKELF